MRLIYIHQYFKFPTESGGTRSYDLARKFIESGIEVTMISTSAFTSEFKNSGGKRWTYIERDGVKFWVLNSRYDQKMSIARRMVAFFEFLWFGTFKTLELGADLVLATSTPFTVAIPALTKKIFHKTPYIFEVRDVWPEGPIELGYVKNRVLIWFLRKYEWIIYRNAYKIVALSSGMKDNIRRRYQDIHNVEVIPNISELNRFSDLTHTIDLNIDLKDKRVILYAGTMGPVNNIMYVAEFAKLLKEIAGNDIVFVIVGDGNEKEKIQQFCLKNGLLRQNVFFVNKIAKNALPYVYSLSTMGSSFVINKTIKWDNSANKFFDTLAAGKPILINHLGWQADLIKSRNIGYVLPPHPTIADAKQFAIYLGNQELLAQQGINARRVARELFSLEVASNQYLRIIKECYHA